MSVRERKTNTLVGLGLYRTRSFPLPLPPPVFSHRPETFGEWQGWRTPSPPVHAVDALGGNRPGGSERLQGDSLTLDLEPLKLSVHATE